ncbi:MAG: hypothetical protein IJ822_01690 [Pyramidobacter sp.]|nr:hypothetical protein [Pyramidobacter sp.]
MPSGEFSARSDGLPASKGNALAGDDALFPLADEGAVDAPDCPQRFIISGRKPFVLAVLSSQAFFHLALRSVSICIKNARGETENEQETKHFLEIFTVKTSYDVLLSLAAKLLSTASTE